MGAAQGFETVVLCGVVEVDDLGAVVGEALYHLLTGVVFVLDECFEKYGCSFKY